MKYRKGDLVQIRVAMFDCDLLSTREVEAVGRNWIKAGGHTFNTETGRCNQRSYNPRYLVGLASAQPETPPEVAGRAIIKASA